jgi:hypothetical protein
MIIAWTRLFLAYFYYTIGNKYYYKQKKRNRYVIVDGERKAWDLKTCIDKYGKLDNPTKENLLFFIKLRNKIEHRNVSQEDIKFDIFGECQSLLYNYERLLVELFGEQYTLNENLAFSLQFSTFRTEEQKNANKKLLTREVVEINRFIEKFRSGLSPDVFNSQNFSVKLIQIPKIINDPRKKVPAIEFVNWSHLSEEDKGNYEKLTALIKNKTVKVEVINPGKLRAGVVVNKVLENCNLNNFTHYDHKCLYFIFSIRPIKKENKEPSDTNTKYCHYDEAHNDYLYKKEWIELLVKLINEKRIKRRTWKQKFEAMQKLDVKDYE